MLDGLPAGIRLDLNRIRAELTKRRPADASPPSGRKRTNSVPQRLLTATPPATPLTLMIENKSQHSKDYEKMKYLPVLARGLYRLCQIRRLSGRARRRAFLRPGHDGAGGGGCDF